MVCTLMSPNKGETTVHGCSSPVDMAVRMREVLARPWVGTWVSVCVPLAFIKSTGNRATITCNLFSNITAKRVKKRCCAFYHPHSTCLETNQVVTGCEKLLQKVKSSSLLATKSVHAARFSGPR